MKLFVSKRAKRVMAAVAEEERLRKEARHREAAKLEAQAAQRRGMNPPYRMDTAALAAGVHHWRLYCNEDDGDPCYRWISRAVMERLTENRTTVTFVSGWRTWWDEDTYFPGWYYRQVAGEEPEALKGMYLNGEKELCLVRRGFAPDLMATLMDPMVEGIQAARLAVYIYGTLPESLDSYEALAKAVKTLPYDGCIAYSACYSELGLWMREAAFPPEETEALLLRICAWFGTPVKINRLAEEEKAHGHV